MPESTGALSAWESFYVIVGDDRVLRVNNAVGERKMIGTVRHE
jgi:hypothetical protein